MFKRLRMALELAQHVDDLQRRVEVLSREWTDFVDMMRAREERQRQRDKKALGRLVQAEKDTEPSPTPTPGDLKAELRRSLAASQGIRRVPLPPPGG